MVDTDNRDELARHAWRLLMTAAQRHLETTSHEIEHLGMSKVMAAFLDALTTMPTGPTNQLATRFGVNPAWVTDIVDRLEARGDVVRCVSPDDRRVKLLELTDAGRSTYVQLEALFATPPPELLDAPIEDLRAFARIAERLGARHETSGSGPASSADQGPPSSAALGADAAS
jgi:DNA-binding MarR family transcriptional regulator